jgi:nucleotide-binding universal stress UspA family protein
LAQQTAGIVQRFVIYLPEEGNMEQTHAPSDILLAVDGSEHAQAATSLLNDMVGEFDCRITIIAVLDTPHTPRRQLLLNALQQAQEALQKTGREVICGLLHGHPAAAICDYANDHSPDLIMLGAKGRRATLGILLGGVAQQVVEYAHHPVLIVRSPYKDLHKILVAIDGSEYSHKALQFLGCLPYTSSAELHIIHITNPSPPFEAAMQPRTWLFGNDIFLPPAVSDEESGRWKEASSAAGENVINEALQIIQPCAIQAKTAILTGDAATEILDYAKRNSIDLIVTGSRGLSSVQGWLLGSVSRKLVHYSSCSVLIVKSNQQT